MMAAVEQPNDYELKANQQLYENVKLLTTNYSCRYELQQVLKEDMFLEPNKTAFNEVVYFLFGLRHMKKTVEKFLNFPPCDIKSEIALRDEIIERVTELNAFYTHADIPILKQWQLIVPRGSEIVIFLLKWSALCMFEHLNQSNMSLNILYPFKPNKDLAKTDIMLKIMQTQTVQTNLVTLDLIHRFLETLECKISEWKDVKQTEIDFIKSKNDSLNDQVPSTDELYKEIDQFLTRFHTFEAASEKLHEIEVIVSEDRTLIHNKEEFKVPEEIQHNLKNEDTLDLFKYFNGVRRYLESRSADLPNAKTEYLQETIIRAEKEKNRYAERAADFKKKHEILTSVQEIIEKMDF